MSKSNKRAGEYTPLATEQKKRTIVGSVQAEDNDDDERSVEMSDACSFCRDNERINDPHKETSPEIQQTTLEIIAEEIVQLKYRVLAACSLLTFGGFYIYDIPGSIGTGPNDTIQNKFYVHGKEYTQEMNQALYSVYSWPNTVFVVFGGLLIDKFLGLRKATVLFASLVTAGAALFAVGVYTVNFPVMIAARVLFGLGGESLNVAQSALIARWFMRGRGMAFAFGMTVSFSRIGSSFSFLLSPKFAGWVNIDFACFMGLAACGISLLSAFLLTAVDYYGEKQGIVPKESKEAGEPFHFSQLKEIPGIIWVICAICISAYSCIFSFVGIAKNFFERKYHMSGSEASDYISIFQFTIVGGSPVVGGLVDHTGRFTYWIILASCTFILEHFLFIVTNISPYVMMPALGIFYSFLASSLWPCVPYAVDETMVGIAYGIMTALLNLGSAVIPLIVGGILTYYTPGNSTATANHTAGSYYYETAGFGNGAFYLPQNGALADDTLTLTAPNATKKAKLPTHEGFVLSEVVFICVAIVGLFFSFLLLFMDKKYERGVLSAVPAARKEIMAELKVERDVARETLLVA